MDKEFTYKDRVTFYKKDMWRSNLVFQTILEELAAAKEAGKDSLRIGNREIKLECIDGFVKCWQVQTILEDRMRAAARILNNLPNDIFHLDLDEDAEAKRIAEEKLWRKQRDEDYEKSVREEAKKQKRKNKK